MMIHIIIIYTHNIINRYFKMRIKTIFQNQSVEVRAWFFDFDLVVLPICTWFYNCSPQSPGFLQCTVIAIYITQVLNVCTFEWKAEFIKMQLFIAIKKKL